MEDEPSVMLHCAIYEATLTQSHSIWFVMEFSLVRTQPMTLILEIAWFAASLECQSNSLLLALTNVLLEFDRLSIVHSQLPILTFAVAFESAHLPFYNRCVCVCVCVCIVIQFGLCHSHRCALPLLDDTLHLLIDQFCREMSVVVVCRRNLPSFFLKHWHDIESIRISIIRNNSTWFNF